MKTENENFDEWAIVELFGHQRLAGRVTNASIGGCSFVRVDVPATEKDEAYTRFLGNGAIYAVNPCTEQVARAAAHTMRAAPVQRYEIPELRQRHIGFSSDDDSIDREDSFLPACE